MILNKQLWGDYRRNRKRTPLCIDCYQYSTYAFIYGEDVLFYCDYHAGLHGATFISRAWDVLEKTYDQLSQEDQE